MAGSIATRSSSSRRVVESSSGNFALGLAVVCREQALKLRIVGDPAIDPSMRGMLHNLGAEVDIEKPDALGAYQRPRLTRVAQLLDAHPNAFWVQQYDNPQNPGAYRPLAERLLEEVGPTFDLVACVGSGGSSVGLATHLRRRSEHVRVTGVDTFNSMLFGLPDGKRTLRGLGNSIMPKILDHTQFDEIHWLTSPQANLAAIELHARCGSASPVTNVPGLWGTPCLTQKPDTLRATDPDNSFARDTAGSIA